MFKKMIIFAGILFSAFSVLSADIITLSSRSFHNDKRITIDDGEKAHGLRFQVSAHYHGEPAMSPMYLSSKIKCQNDKKLKPIDLGTLLKNRYGKDVEEFLGAPNTVDRSGRIHVCALENANFDENILMISVLRGTALGCDQSRVVDFIFPISEICSH